MSAQPVNDVEDPHFGDKIVISGMSGLFPDCHNVNELSDLLYNKVDPIKANNTRWKYDHPEMIPNLGQIPEGEMESFDAQFFKISFHMANRMDPLARKVLENVYQAMYDAGVSPAHVVGKKIAVVFASGTSESDVDYSRSLIQKYGFSILGWSKSMISNRVSYWINSKAPSFIIYQPCNGSLGALELAVRAIQSGDCEAALVGGYNACLHPQLQIHYKRLGNLSPDGVTRSFDKNAAGYARSEALSILLLQKAKDAKRCYAEVVFVKSKFTLSQQEGLKPGYCRNSESMAKIIKKMYEEADISPQNVEYVEAFGCAIPEADKAELDTIDEVFCKGRNDPLLVGSVLSNIGYTECASGICAIIKVLLAYRNGRLAPNLHCTSPRQDVAALRDGRIRIVTESQPFKGTYAAVNCISFTGISTHLLLRGSHKTKDISRYKSNIPYLVPLSCRHHLSIKKFVQDLKSRPIDPEEIALLHGLNDVTIPGHLGRGYTILDTNEKNETIIISENATYFDEAARPLWFVYSGMGSQWAGMGKQLMRISTFAAAIKKCQAALEPKGLDIVNIITSPDPKIFDNILHSFVGIAAIQIGLTDILRELGLFPDKIIGHSVGELGCAYADDCFTAEEMILSAYSRGLVSIETPFIFGSMAAVGVGYQKINKILPPEIEVACRNSATSCTISGPSEVMKDFIKKLIKQNIFAKEVLCSNIAYHSRYIADAGPGLLKYMKEIIKTPKLRTSRWMSTSVPQDQWDEPHALYSSAEYHTSNMLNPVLFEETSKLIPRNAVLIEIAPHGLLQAILKRSLSSTCLNVPLALRGHPDNVKYLLDAIGELFTIGFNPMVRNLYPKIEYPVSVGTPMLSSFVDWAHDEKCYVGFQKPMNERNSAIVKNLISISDDEHTYFKGHQFKGEVVYPFAAALVAAWDTFAMTLGLQKKKISVQFKDVHCYSQPKLPNGRLLKLRISLHRGNGQFEVMNERSRVISGYIKTLDEKHPTRSYENTSPEETYLSSDEIYKLFNLRSNNYLDDFRSIYRADVSLSKAQILWNDNWVTFLDGIFQLDILKQALEMDSHLCFIKRLDIDVSKAHWAEVTALENGKKVITAHVSDVNYRCGGVFLNGMQLRHVPRKENNSKTEILQFVPHFSTSISDEISILNVYLQIVVENSDKEVINILEVVRNENNSTNSIIKDMTHQFTEQKFKFVTTSKNHINEMSLNDVDVLIYEQLSTDDDMCQVLYRFFGKNCFIINKEDEKNDANRPSLLYRIVCEHRTDTARLELIRWRPATSNAGTSVISVMTPSDLPLFTSTLATLPPKQNMFVLSGYPALPKLKNTIKKCRKDINSNIYLIMIKDDINLNENFDIQSPDLIFNIVNDGIMGGEYYLPIQSTSLSGEELTLECPSFGDLKSLRWTKMSQSSPEVGIPVKVSYAGLNTVDAKTASGIAPINETKKNKYGMDFSGVVESNGARVMGLIETGAVRTKILASPYFLWPVPNHWTLEEAATVPLAYTLALYCLIIRSKLQAGMRIFVHGGTGALAQAIISIALAYDCEVFTTVSNIEKKRFLRRLFPELKDDHIGNSRNEAFVDMVKIKTDSTGCDIVICSVKGHLKDASLRCCAASGITIDTSLLQDNEDYSIGMDFMFKSRGFATVNLASIFANNNVENMKKLQLLLTEGIKSGYVRPLSRVTYAARDVARAFRLLAAGRHRGRVLLDLQNHGISTTQPRLKCPPELYNLVISDSDELGIQLADKLISRGCKKLYLQWGNSSSLLQFKTRSWRNNGIEVSISSDNVLEKNNIQKFLQTVEEVRPFGIFIVTNDESYGNEIENLLKRSSLLTKKLKPTLRYIARVKFDDNLEENKCHVTCHDSMVKLIKFPKARDDKTRSMSKNIMPTRDVVDAIEYAIIAKEPTITLKWSPKRLTILEDITSLIGINFEDINVTSTTTLEDLGVEPFEADIVQGYFRDNHNIGLSHKEVLMLNLKEINKIDINISEQQYVDDIQGLDAVFSEIDYEDEIIATDSIIYMQTLTRGAAKISTQEFDSKEKSLCVLPGVEGQHGRFKGICKRLKLPALALHIGCDDGGVTIQEMAERLIPKLPMKLSQAKKFYLLGYEYGVLVALEIAAILEQKGLTGTVFCIGGAPEDIRALVDEKLKDYKTDEDLQIAVIRHVFKVITGSSMLELDEALREAKTWEERLDVTKRFFKGRVTHSMEYTRQLIKTVYARISQLISYTTTPRLLRSLLVSIRPQLSSGGHHTSSMQKYSEVPIVEYNLKVPLGYITQDLHCSSIINRHLDADILEDFGNRNHYDTYF